MKTQLLEDIGQSATLSLTPKIVGNFQADKEVQVPARAANANPAKPRSALGVWRQKPAGEPLIATTQQPSRQPTPLELHKVFEEIAALEAQYVPPRQPHEPAIAPVEPQQELPTPPAGPLHKPAISPAEPTLASHPTQSATAPQDPLFDFAPPSPALQVAGPFTRAPTSRPRFRQRYLLWAAFLLSAALLIQGGRSLYQERFDAGSLALIGAEANEEPEVDNAAKRRAMAAQEITQGPDGGVGVTPAVPASPRLPAAPPPLVLLEPAPSAATKVEQLPPLGAGRNALQAPPKPEPVAEEWPASPSPKPSSRMAREQAGAAAGRAMEPGEREPVRQFARASAIGTDGAVARDTAMAATLRACREHGYHAAQCIKRACSVTKHGFVCRGR